MRRIEATANIIVQLNHIGYARDSDKRLIQFIYKLVIGNIVIRLDYN